MNSETTLSARLKEAVGVNVSAFARKSGVGESLLRQYIAGSKPGIDKAAAIAQAAGVSLEWLATGAAPKLLSGIEKPVNLNEQPATYPLSPLAGVDYQEVLDDIALVVREVEKIILEQGATMAPEAKGKLMALVFDHITTRDEKIEEPVGDKIIRLMKLGT